MTGFILLVVLAFLCAWLITKVGQKVRVNISNKRMVGIMVVFIIVALALWGQKGIHK